MKAQEFFSNPRVIWLTDAADRGDTRDFAAAVSSGVDPNTEGKEGITPLLFVLASTQNKDGLRLLLKAGADPNRMTRDGMCPTILGARAKDTEYLTIMLDGGGDPNLKNISGEPVLQVAARDARWENVAQLLKRGADINGVDGSGFNVLMNLTALRRYEQIAWLIEKGADVKMKTPNGTPLAQMVKDGTVRADSPAGPWRDRVILLLKQRGVDLPR